jgi:hypothetical protein
MQGPHSTESISRSLRLGWGKENSHFDLSGALVVARGRFVPGMLVLRERWLRLSWLGDASQSEGASEGVPECRDVRTHGLSATVAPRSAVVSRMHVTFDRIGCRVTIRTMSAGASLARVLGLGVRLRVGNVLVAFCRKLGRSIHYLTYY